MPTGFVSAFAKEAGSSGFVSTVADAVRAAGACTSAGAAAGVLVGLAPAVATWVGVLGGGVLLDWLRDRKNEKKAKERFEEIRTRLAAIESVRHDEKELLGLVDELFAKANAADVGAAGELLEGVVGAVKGAAREEGNAVTANVDAWFKGVRIYLSSISAEVRETRDNTRALVAGQGRLESGQEAILSEQQHLSAAVDDIAQRFAAMQQDSRRMAALESENAELHEKLRAATERYVRAEAARGRPWREAIAELRKHPDKLIEFLDTEIDRDELDLIEKHRERAAVCYVTGEIEKAEESLRKILALVPNDLDAVSRLGNVRFLRGELEEAAALYAKVGTLAMDDEWRAISLSNLGMIEKARGNLDAAEKYYKQALAIDLEGGNLEGIAIGYGNLGSIARARSNFDAAEEYFKQSLDFNGRLGRHEGMANQYNNLGTIERIRGEIDKAEKHYRQALAINERLKRREGMADQYANLGNIELTRGNVFMAEEYHKNALAISTKLGKLEGMAAAYGNLGNIENTRRNLDAAEDLYKKSLAINERLSRLEGMANQYFNLGGIALQRQDSAEATRLWTLSRDLFKKIGNKPQEALVQGWLDGLNGS